LFTVPRSTLRAKLFLAFAALIGIAVAVTALSLRTASEARFLLERSRLAHAVLEQYLALHVDTLGLFKQLVDAVIAGTPIDAPGEDARRGLSERIGRLRDAILAEVTFVAGTSETEAEQDEFRDVVAIEEETRQIRAAFRDVRDLVRQGATEQAWPLLARILDERIDGRLAGLLGEAIAEEAREVAEADRTALATLRRAETTSTLAAVAAVLIGLAIAVVFQRQVRKPLERLLAGTQALGRGEFGHRIALDSGDELGELAASLDGMADRIERGRQELLASRDALEETVSARTEELRGANAALTRADQVRRRFFTDISHELRTPLTVIRGESEIALRGGEKSSEDHKTALGRVLEQAGQLGRLVDDLLFVARADAGAARIDRQTVNLASVLRGVCRDGIVLGREAGVQVELREHTPDSSLVGDPSKLRQLFLILVDNAVRYSRPNGLVTVDLSPAPRGLVVRVADEGVGIPPEEVDTIFERFRRGANAPGHNGEGSGLGLPLAKVIVDAHGGKINVESELDRGTTVTLFLPASGKLRAIA
jgi:signal transduction histidine kinase